jgi:hypothetical protein
MRTLGVSMLALVASTAAAYAQDNALPESMRIEQSVTQQNAAGGQAQGASSTSAAGGGATTSSEAPGGETTGVEMKRLDPSAPSPNRLQIDDGTSATVRQNPDVNALHPGASGTSYNTILRGAPSTNGVSSGGSAGTSGLGNTSGGIGAGSAGSGAASAGGK